MNIDKAIKILTDDLDHPTEHLYAKHREAEKLGIEALKRCQELRKYTDPNTYMPLPGETT